MAIWMDLTNSLVVWQGGVVGIVRAELEIAKNMHEIDNNIKYCVCKENSFVEIDENELNWLWNAKNVGDAYLFAMGRNKKKEVEKEIKQKNFYEDYDGLARAKLFSESRLIRVGEAIKTIVSLFPTPLRQIVYYPAKLIYKPLRKLSIYRANYKFNKSCKLNITNSDTNMNHKTEYPFKNGDVVFSCGWFGSNKEAAFSKVKSELNDLKLAYLIYDIIILKKEFRHLYSHLTHLFSEYIGWISSNCDYILYGGATAKKDTEDYLAKKGLHIPKGDWIKFGNAIGEHVAKKKQQEILKNIGLDEKYILSVGTIEPRKNYKTIYQCYTIMAEKFSRDEIPKLVIVGKNVDDTNLLEMIQSHPMTKEKIVVLQPTDEELDALYQNCEFTILPSLYEGWSLTLPEALNYGKLCVCSDVPPLREIASEITLFVESEDPWAWCETIMNLMTNANEINQWEEKIKKDWQPVTWLDSATMIHDNLTNLTKYNDLQEHNLYYDATLIWHSSFVNASVSGILRTQLLMARYLSRIYPKMKFFALTPNKYYELTRYDLANILGTDAIDVSFFNDRSRIIESSIQSNDLENENANNQIVIKLKQAFWLLCSVLPLEVQKIISKVAKKRKDKINKNQTNLICNVELPFKENDVVFSTGTGYTLDVYDNLIKQHDDIGFLYVQLIYDYTPILTPQTHRKMTLDYYPDFLYYSSELSDVIFYGGATAMRDGIQYQIDNEQKIRPAYVMRFGSNVVGEIPKKERVEEIMKYYQIEENYILTVGSIEARKNHETLYKAYVKMIEDGENNIPQLIICGYPGWKTEDFIKRLDNDERVRGKIMHRTFSDEELNVLYRNCLFTVLPSMYEGWSLTLPESLNYGKFCIASDVDPLREIGQDFIDYVHPYDSNSWAKKILHYATCSEALKEKETKIKNEWHAITWQECAEETAKALNQLMENGPDSFKIS